MLTVTLEGDKELRAKLKQMPAKIQAALLKQVWMLSLGLERHIKQNKLQGQVLGHRSGNLQRSIQSTVDQSRGSVMGRVFSAGDVKYAGIHEYGGRIPAHIIEPKNAEALKFMMNGKMVFAKRVNHPGSTMPERSFMRSSLRDKRAEIVAGLTKAIEEGTRL